jgi:hypothetical protein
MTARTIARNSARTLLVVLLTVLSFLGVSVAGARIADDSAGTAKPIDTEVNTLPVPKEKGADIDTAVVTNSPPRVVQQSKINIPGTSATSRECADGSGSRSQLNLLNNSRVPGYC